jgi:phospholipid/cholesterol/gamma-HCH transport system substrate-binding protein
MEPTQTFAGRTLLQLRVGAFILAGLAVLLGLVYFLGRQSGMFESQYRLRAPFAHVGGLIEGATVRLAGVPVGRVTAIRLPDDMAGRKVQVELAVVQRVQNRIRADSVARIETLGLLGDKIVELSLGSPDAAVLGEGGELQTEEPLDTNRVMKQGTELLRNLVEVSADLKTTIGKLGASAAGPDLVETVRSVRALATEIEKGRGLLHQLIYDPRLGTTVADATGTLRQVTETVKRLDRLLADPRTAGLAEDARRAIGDAADAMRQVNATAQRLDRLLADPKTAGLVDDARQAVAEARGAVERVNRLVRQVEEGQGLLHTLVYGESRLVQDLDRLLGRAGALVASVERGEGALGVLLRDQETARAIKRVAAAAEGLAQGVDRAREGDGLLQALLFDPRGKEVVADLRETARHFREVTARVARGDGLIGQLTQPGTEDTVKQFAQGLAGLGQLGSDLAKDGRLGEALADLRAAMANLRDITARVEAGEGTIGGLIQDPTIYENLAAFLEGAQRSLLLRALIRAAIGRGGSER